MIPQDLFDAALPPEAARAQLAPGAVLLHGFARDMDAPLLQAIEAVITQAPLRDMQTPVGYAMSGATTSCGSFGWVSDARDYRYAALDPRSGQSWPAIPACFWT